MPDGVTHVTIRVKGTLGCLAPEYKMLAKASESCNIYSFGILLPELASGRKPIEKLSPTMKRTIIDWAPPLAGKRKFSELADPTGESKEKLADLENDESFKGSLTADFNDGLSGADDSSESISEEKDSIHEVKEEEPGTEKVNLN
ncbi:hypothetical protein RJ641_024325 [Dillenia turbinata]|uniref:Protein kinase domain-containing protein n=1 Tax=Dillenia turbinata TaxID=194707 RepID=A0AAN8UKL7_9MAGN